MQSDAIQVFHPCSLEQGRLQKRRLQHLKGKQSYQIPGQTTRVSRLNMTSDFTNDPLFTGPLNRDAKDKTDTREGEGPASQARTNQESDLGELIKNDC